MTNELQDSDTLSVSAAFLDTFIPGQSISSPKRLLPGHQDVYWWMMCFPNGTDNDTEGHVSVRVYTKGFVKSATVTILGSDTKSTETKFTIVSTFDKIASHPALKSDDIIKNGVFVVKCEVVVDIPNDYGIKVDTIEDSCIIKFDRKLIETCFPGESIVIPERIVDGLMWWIEYFPCGVSPSFQNYVSVFVHTHGEPLQLGISCAMRVDNVYVQKTSPHDYAELGPWCSYRCFSHDQCEMADNEDGIIDIMCSIILPKRDNF